MAAKQKSRLVLDCDYSALHRITKIPNPPKNKISQYSLSNVPYQLPQKTQTVCNYHALTGKWFIKSKSSLNIRFIKYNYMRDTFSTNKHIYEQQYRTSQKHADAQFIYLFFCTIKKLIIDRK